MQRIQILGIILGMLFCGLLQPGLLAQETQVKYRVYYKSRYNGEVRQSRTDYETKGQAEAAAEDLRTVHAVSEAWVEEVKVAVRKPRDLTASLAGTDWSGRDKYWADKLCFRFSDGRKATLYIGYFGGDIRLRGKVLVVDDTVLICARGNGMDAIFNGKVEGGRMSGTVRWYKDGEEQGRFNWSATIDR